MDGSLPLPGLSPAASAALPSTGAGSASTPKAGAGNGAVRKAAEEFESQFMSQMLTQMWQGISTDGYFGGGHGEEMFRGLMLNEYGKQITKTGGLGIADMVQKAMLKMQEV
jgi:flagellar protein FlgJ